MSVYLDYAATSALRPPEVIEAVHTYLVGNGATPGRGAYARAREAGHLVLGARRAVLELLGVGGDPGRFVFTANATDALNTALFGLLEPGDVAVVTALDHNAVLRPVHALARTRGVRVRTVGADTDGALDDEALERALEGARLLVVNAASNVLGTVADVPGLAARAHRAGALVLVDAAQTAGHHPVSVADADLIAVTGHKGLLGPQGTGGLWIREGVELRPFRHGGTGGDSREPGMPEALPDRFEAGTLNGPGIAGLLAGCRWVARRGVEAIHRHEAASKERLRQGLDALPGVRVLSPPAPAGTGVVTIVARRGGPDPAVLAHRLDRDYDIQVRSGLHCAPGAHELLGTDTSGAVRFSTGWTTTGHDVDRAVAAVDEITRTPLHPVPRAAGTYPPS
jgi:cysteine desulfurase family protein